MSGSSPAFPLPPPGGPPPAALAYQVVDARALADNNHLRLLAIFHYIWGAMAMLFSSLFIFHIVIGIVALNNPNFFAPPVPMAAATAPAAPGPPQPSPAFFGWMFVIMGTLGVLLGWTAGILTILSGRGIAKRKWRMFSLVMAGVNCLSVPIGTALGVFTFVVLLRESVRVQYAGGRLSGPPV